MHVLAQQQRGAENQHLRGEDRHQQVVAMQQQLMGMVAELQERLCTVPAQTREEIDSAMQAPDLSAGQKQVGSHASWMLRACYSAPLTPAGWSALQVLELLREQSVETEATIRRFWLEPSELQLHEPLGQGSSGQVFRATYQQREVAAKLLGVGVGVGVGTAGLSELLQSSEPLVASMRRELVVMARPHQFSFVCGCASWLWLLRLHCWGC
jgi:hypothetical protein